MSRSLRVFGAVLIVALLAPQAFACWDNTDRVILQLKKLDLSTEQLKEIFALQKEHRAVITRAHEEDLGCRYHEDHEAVFQKKAIGVLTDTQFKKQTGRERNEVEALTYENYKLRKEIARLKAELEKLCAELEAKK
jgi:hypothetical protein